jgi:hypothetical protein
MRRNMSTNSAHVSAQPPAAPVADQVERPHWAWWVSIGFGMSLLAVLSLSDAAYALWAGQVTTLFSQPLLRLILLCAVAAHLGEGLYAWQIAGQLGLSASRGGWAVQTVMLGFPSLRLLLLRRKAPALWGQRG